MKKLFAILLALTLAMTCFAACGSNGGDSSAAGGSSAAEDSTSSSVEEDETSAGDSELPTISLMIVCGTTPPDADAVAAELSKITSEKIGCNVEFVTFEVGNSKQQIQLLLSGGDDTLDVYWADGGGTSVNFVSAAENGQAMPLEEVMEPYADGMKEALGEEVYNAGIVNGVQYGVGRLLDQASVTVFNLRADVAEACGYSRCLLLHQP